MANPSATVYVGQQLHGFTVTDVTPLETLNVNLVQLRHDRTKARMVHLESTDDNNLFAVGFRTTPQDSTGVAHILEHTVLCGSRHFPVRDPFFSMLKRSLNTFMNALTSSDWTLYPFSSQNHKDFYNLLDVYLDAAFFPRLRQQDFRQEGHRLEFANPEDSSSELTFQGVVFNEMKGAMADPSSLLGRRLTRCLYPKTTYGNNSGGEPADIVNLSWQDLKDFHKRYYHPSNAYFFTYGNFPLNEHLARIEDRVLQHFDFYEVDSAVPDETRFNSPHRCTETFPIDSDESSENKAMVQLAWLTCPVANSFERLSLSILSLLLLGNPAAPLYKALLDSKLGQNLAPGCGFQEDYRETYFAAGLQGTNPDSNSAVEQIVLSTLEEAAKNGFSDDKIEAAIHQLEFAHREVVGDSYPYPLLLLMRMMGPWIHNGDPVTPLLFDQDLQRLREELKSGPFFQNLIRRYLLDNQHRVTLLLKPDPNRKKEDEEVLLDRARHLGATMSSEDRLELQKINLELKTSQEQQEDLSCLPTLELEDVPVAERKISHEEETIENCRVFRFDQPTNGICYFTANFRLDQLPEELQSYVPIFCSILPKIGAAGQDYLAMTERIASATGGIRSSTAIHELPLTTDSFRPAIELRGKALIRNIPALFDIWGDLCLAADFDDLQRLHTILNQVKISLENSIPSSGHSYAARAAGAKLTAGGRQREDWNGLVQIRLIRQLAKQKPDELATFAERLKALAGHLLTRSDLNCALAVEKQYMEAAQESLSKFLRQLPAGASIKMPGIEPFSPGPQREGWATSVPVAYAAQAFRTVPYGHPDCAGLLVLAKLLRAGFLHREIREKGGAYGGFASYDPDTSLFSMLSYRDPNPARTLETYGKAADWAAAGSYSEEDIKEAILSVFAELDRPLSPSGRAGRAFSQQIKGLTEAMRQQMRATILATDKNVLKDLSQRYLVEQIEKSSIGVIGAEDLLRQTGGALSNIGRI